MRKITNVLVFFLLIFSSCLIQGCSTLEKQTNFQKFQSIVFGKTGGFSNINNSYTIVSSGRVSSEAAGKYKMIRNLGKRDIRKIDKELNSINYTSLDLSERGNITYYIEVIYADSSKKNTWIETTENEEIKNLYKLLISFLNP